LIKRENLIVRERFAGFLLVEHYNYHILVFLIAFFIALTFAHPQFFVTDEWVTANQLAQIHAGHQVFVNEGKYGFLNNGTPTSYFIAKNNLLGYSIFLPLISLPAYWFVDWLGDQFVYGILILWTFIPFCIGILLKYSMNDPRTFGNWKISSILFITSFLLFFVNLFYYIPFEVTGRYPYPEFLAIVFTNTLFYTLLAVLIYCILLEIFTDKTYSLFGTFVCLSGSSYLVWSTSMKDHMLLALLYGALLVSVVYYFKRHDRWFFPVSCIIIGLIAWARPELALPTFIGSVAFYWFTYGLIISHPNRLKDFIFIICSPLFVLIGALPFFINNYFITGDPLLPTWAVWPTDYSLNSTSILVSTESLTSGSLNPIEKITQIIIANVSIRPDTFFNDLYGVLFNPQTGSIGVFSLTPLFLIALFLIPLIIFTENRPFSKEEKYLLFSMVLFSFLVFAAYIYQINGLNSSPGVAPDIRYLSPAYLSLNIFGLIILKKIPEFSKNPRTLLKIMLLLWVIIIPLFLVLNARYYPAPGPSWPALFYPLDTITSLIIYVLISLFLLLHLLGIFLKKQHPCCELLIILTIISIPFVWQVLTSVNIWNYGRGLGGYPFWIPIVRVFYSFLFSLSPIH
jgi:hypothetical protein